MGEEQRAATVNLSITNNTLIRPGYVLDLSDGRDRVETIEASAVEIEALPIGRIEGEIDRRRLNDTVRLYQERETRDRLAIERECQAEAKRMSPIFRPPR